MKRKIALTLILCLLIPAIGNAQKRIRKMVVTGTVIDESGIPLSGISIFVDNIKTQEVTDNNGTYRIRIKPETRTVSAFSFENGGQVMEFDQQEEINFTLNIDFNPVGLKVERAGEVVDIGYQTAEKQNLTTSVGSVNMDRVSKSNYTNIYDMIKGEVPGVTVNGKQIRIRGNSSMNLSNQPLFVLDGSSISNVDNLNPNDIESISILKGASAAIYGSRGSNGVIVMRSKTYKKEKK